MKKKEKYVDNMGKYPLAKKSYAIYKCYYY